MKKYLFFLFVSISNFCFGTNYYVDPTYSGSNGASNGSFAKPWTALSQVNNHSFSTGDGLYFKTRTTIVMTGPFYTRWSGEEGNPGVVGAYYPDGRLGAGNVASDDKPILSGNDWRVPAQILQTDGSYTAPWSALINHVNRLGYMIIQDLKIHRSGGTGIDIGVSSNNISIINSHNVVRNCEIFEPWRQGIVVGRSSHNLVERNIVGYSSYGNQRTHPFYETRERIAGASIEITGMHMRHTRGFDLTHDNKVVENEVFHSSYEGIGVYKQAPKTLVDNNVVYDCSVNIYIGRTTDVIISNNLVYSTTNTSRAPNRSRCIPLIAELEAYKFEVPVGNITIHNNYVGGCATAVEMGVYPEATEHGWQNVHIYNNIFVDNNTNIKYSRPNLGSWSNNKIENNLFFHYTPELRHYHNTSGNDMAPNSSFSFTGNKYTWANQSGYQTISGAPANNASFNVEHLVIKTGWRTLEKGLPKKDWFLLVKESSLAAPRGLTIQ